eukprot:TRINITY_DN77641_c0_g1_i1.p1 TRINITY_DN77641_c0_g1~~TRINITY_DN77641_c0_g1_i1.p1  ORF type:complete len:104 (-),score=0.10 TRINITY_DN77641_c0_g1_i1:256-567(-)
MVGSPVVVLSWWIAEKLVRGDFPAGSEIVFSATDHTSIKGWPPPKYSCWWSCTHVIKTLQWQMDFHAEEHMEQWTLFVMAGWSGRRGSTYMYSHCHKKRTLSL